MEILRQDPYSRISTQLQLLSDAHNDQPLEPVPAARVASHCAHQIAAAAGQIVIRSRSESFRPARAHSPVGPVRSHLCSRKRSVPAAALPPPAVRCNAHCYLEADTKSSLQRIFSNQCKVPTRLLNVTVNLNSLPVICHHVSPVLQLASRVAGMRSLAPDHMWTRVWSSHGVSCSPPCSSTLLLERLAIVLLLHAAVKHFPAHPAS